MVDPRILFSFVLLLPLPWLSLLSYLTFLFYRFNSFSHTFPNHSSQILQTQLNQYLSHFFTISSFFLLLPPHKVLFSFTFIILQTSMLPYPDLASCFVSFISFLNVRNANAIAKMKNDIKNYLLIKNPTIFLFLRSFDFANLIFFVVLKCLVNCELFQNFICRRWRRNEKSYFCYRSNQLSWNNSICNDFSYKHHIDQNYNLFKFIYL